MKENTKQAEETRRMAEALRGMQEKLDALKESKEGVIAEWFDGEAEDFDTEEYLGDELGVLIDVLISQLRFADYGNEGDPEDYIVCEYLLGKVDYEAVLAEVALSHETREIIIKGDDHERYPAYEGV